MDINGHERAIEDLQLSHDCVPTLDENMDQIINALAESQKSLKAKSEVCIVFTLNRTFNFIRIFLNKCFPHLNCFV